MSDYQKLKWFRHIQSWDTDTGSGEKITEIGVNSDCPLWPETPRCLQVTENKARHVYLIQHGDNPEAIKEIDHYDFVSSDNNLIEDWLEEVHAYLRGQDARR